MVEIELPSGVWRKGQSFYFRRRWREDGKRRTEYVRLPHPLAPNFAAAYERAQGETASGPVRGSVDAMIAAFLSSPRFAEIGPSAAAKYREAFRRLSVTYGAHQTHEIRRPHMIAFLEPMAAAPAMANRVLSCCNVLWKWAIARELAGANPCDGVERFKERRAGGPWPLEDVERAAAEMAPHLAAAVALAFYTGQREGDLLRLAPSHRRGSRLTFTQAKTGVTVTLELNDHAAEILDALEPRDGGPYLRNESGAAWTPAKDGSFRGFQGQFAKERKRLGIDPALRFHDLRHTAATVAEEAQPGVAGALLGHTDARSTARYTRHARQTRDASAAAAVIPLLPRRT